MESREVDYMSDSDSDAEVEIKVGRVGVCAGYFLVGGKGGIFPPLTAVFPPFRLAVVR